MPSPSSWPSQDPFLPGLGKSVPMSSVLQGGVGAQIGAAHALVVGLPNGNGVRSPAFLSRSKATVAVGGTEEESHALVHDAALFARFFPARRPAGKARSLRNKEGSRKPAPGLGVRSEADSAPALAGRIATLFPAELLDRQSDLRKVVRQAALRPASRAAWIAGINRLIKTLR